MAANEDAISIEEIDKMLTDLESALDSTVSKDVPEEQSKVFMEKNYKLYFECPTEIWLRFQEYCKTNDLDPSQQLREGIAAHYRDILQAYKAMKRFSR